MLISISTAIVAVCWLYVNLSADSGFCVSRYEQRARITLHKSLDIKYHKIIKKNTRLYKKTRITFKITE